MTQQPPEQEETEEDPILTAATLLDRFRKAAARLPLDAVPRTVR